MRVASSVCNLSFGRALTNEELREYNQVPKIHENKLESLKKINEIIKEEYESKPASKNKIVASLIGLGALGLASFSYFDGKIKSQKTTKSEKIEDRPSLVKNA